MGDANPRGPVKSGVVDTHCHPFLMDREPPEVVEASRAAGVDTLVSVGVDPQSSRRSVELAESFRGVFATVGMHPHTASELDARAGAEIEELLENPQVVGVGETGLDFFRRLSPPEDQERALRLHAALSRESGRPLVVHCRDAWDAILRVLEEEGAERAVLHCFSGDATIARECVARGWYLSFAANITYPKNENLRGAAAATPIDHLLVETDSPYLAPQPMRGRDNEPANAVAVVEELARVKDATFDAIAGATSANARAAFAGLR